MRALRPLVLAAALACVPAVEAQQTAAPVADPINSAASHIAIYDVGAAQMLYCRDCQTPMPPASMSKLMTMLIVSDELKAGRITPATEFQVSENAWRHGAQSDGSHMFLELNSRVKVEDLIKGVIIVSANDACIALAEGISGSEAAFVELMNRRARELGLDSASFRNVTGLPDPDHLISSADLARLAGTIITAHPELYRLYAEPSFTFNGKTQENRNPLLGRFAGADGVKTGHTSVSGYGLIGSAVLNGQRRIIVFNGTRSMAERATEANRLMNAAFHDFNVSQLYAKGAEVAQAEVWLGGKKTVPLVAEDQISVVIHRSQRAGLKAYVAYEGPLRAPIKKGQVVAKLVVEGPGIRREFPLAAAKNVGRANWFSRAGVGLGRLLGGEG